MSKKQDLDRAEQTVRDASAKAEAMKFHVRKLEQEIALHKGLVQQFKQNLDVLKSDGIIPLASEYRKTRTDLNTVRGRLRLLEIELNNSNVFLDRAEKHLLESIDLYDTLLKKSEDCVIEGKFGDRQE